MQFADELVARGCSGGYAAADFTRAAIEDCIQQSDLLLEEDTAVAITVFANLEALATKSSQAGLAVREFAGGFNDTELLTKFSDIGQSVRSQARLEGALDNVLKDDRCLQVVFVGPTWHGFGDYVQRQHRYGQRLFLSKTSAIPLPGLFREVRQRSKVAKIQWLPSIDTVLSVDLRGQVPFSRVGALDGGQVSSGRDVRASDVVCTRILTKHPTSAINMPYHTGTLDTDLTAPVELCTVSDNGHLQTTEAMDNLVRHNSATTSGSSCRSPRLRTIGVDTGESSACGHENVQKEDAEQAAKKIPRNQAGQRVDPPIKVDKDVRLRISGEKWCSNHQLKGHCSFSNCGFKHDLLHEAGKDALLSLARGNPCRKGNACNDTDCYAGHHCPYNPCKKGKACPFSKHDQDMHVHDRQIVDVESLSQPWSHQHRT